MLVQQMAHESQSARFAAQLLDRLDNLSIDHVSQHVLDDVHGLFVGHAQALDELRLDAGLLHGLGDGFAAAVDNHGVNAHGLEENDIRRDSFAHLQVGRVHETAAVLDDKGRAAEPLHVWQRFQQDIGFFDQILHQRTLLIRPCSTRRISPSNRTCASCICPGRDADGRQS